MCEHTVTAQESNLLQRLRSAVPSVGAMQETSIGISGGTSSDVTTVSSPSVPKNTLTKSGKHSKQRKGCIITSNSFKLLIAFAVGQITQLVLQGMVVSLNMWDNKRVLFCSAFGFVILFAVISGVVIADKQDEKLERDYKEKKSYLDWAKIPEDETDAVKK